MFCNSAAFVQILAGWRRPVLEVCGSSPIDNKKPRTSHSGGPRYLAVAGANWQRVLRVSSSRKMPSKSRRLGNRRPLKEKELRIASLANEILGRAQLPCKVVFSKYDTRVNASHVWFKSGRCYLVINSYADIGVPEHVILHEAAHHGQKSERKPWARMGE